LDFTFGNRGTEGNKNSQEEHARKDNFLFWHTPPRCETVGWRRPPYRRGLGPSVSDQGQKFVAGLLVVPERTQHGAGNRLAVLFFDAAHLHTQVARFDDYADAFRADLFGD